MRVLRRERELRNSWKMFELHSLRSVFLSCVFAVGYCIICGVFLFYFDYSLLSKIISGPSCCEN